MTASPCDPARAALLEHFDRDAVLDIYEAAPGDEITSGKVANPASSAALAANLFGPGVMDPDFLHAEDFGFAWPKPANRVELEAVIRFPWSGGRHPCLDALLTGEGWLLGVESKRYEPFRSKSAPAFSEAFDRPVWSGLERHDRLRRAVQSGETKFARLDAAQLVKHALALHAEAQRKGVRAGLVYLYAEPERWPDGRRVDRSAMAVHRQEVQIFVDAVAGDCVVVAALSYRALLTRWATRPEPLARHAQALLDAFDL